MKFSQPHMTYSYAWISFQTFKPLVDNVGLWKNKHNKPVEFLGDLRLDFQDCNKLRTIRVSQLLIHSRSFEYWNYLLKLSCFIIFCVNPIFWFKHWDPTIPGINQSAKAERCINAWSELQDGQQILITTPSVLLGFRTKVYRAEGTTQWYTAVTTGYNETTSVSCFAEIHVKLNSYNSIISNWITKSIN